MLLLGWSKQNAAQPLSQLPKKKVGNHRQGISLIFASIHEAPCGADCSFVCAASSLLPAIYDTDLRSHYAHASSQPKKRSTACRRPPQIGEIKSYCLSTDKSTKTGNGQGLLCRAVCPLLVCACIHTFYVAAAAVMVFETYSFVVNVTFHSIYLAVVLALHQQHPVMHHHHADYIVCTSFLFCHLSTH